MNDYQAEFKAFQGEWESESAYLVWPEETRVTHLRVFKDKGGLVRLDLQVVERGASERPEHVQIVVGQSQLMRRLADPQDVP
jgi:hypothetical protein